MSLELHRATCRAARNRLLLELTSGIHGAPGRFRRTTFLYPGRLPGVVAGHPEVVAGHEELVRAPAARDPERAERVARRHMERTVHGEHATHVERAAHGERAAHMERAAHVRPATCREEYGTPPGR